MTEFDDFDADSKSINLRDNAQKLALSTLADHEAFLAFVVREALPSLPPARAAYIRAEVEGLLNNVASIRRMFTYDPDEINAGRDWYRHLRLSRLTEHVAYLHGEPEIRRFISSVHEHEAILAERGAKHTGKKPTDITKVICKYRREHPEASTPAKVFLHLRELAQKRDHIVLAAGRGRFGRERHAEVGRDRVPPTAYKDIPPNAVVWQPVRSKGYRLLKYTDLAKTLRRWSGPALATVPPPPPAG